MLQRGSKAGRSSKPPDARENRVKRTRPRPFAHCLSRTALGENRAVAGGTQLTQDRSLDVMQFDAP